MERVIERGSAVRQQRAEIITAGHLRCLSPPQTHARTHAHSYPLSDHTNKQTNNPPPHPTPTQPLPAPLQPDKRKKKGQRLDWYELAGDSGSLAAQRRHRAPDAGGFGGEDGGDFDEILHGGRRQGEVRALLSESLSPALCIAFFSVLRPVQPVRAVRMLAAAGCSSSSGAGAWACDA